MFSNELANVLMMVLFSLAAICGVLLYFRWSKSRESILILVFLVGFFSLFFGMICLADSSWGEKPLSIEEDKVLMTVLFPLAGLCCLLLGLLWNRVSEKVLIILAIIAFECLSLGVLILWSYVTLTSAMNSYASQAGCCRYF